MKKVRGPDKKQRKTPDRKRNPSIRTLMTTEREVFRRLAVPRRLWGTPAGEIVAFAHTLIVPQGILVGSVLRLRDFQIAFIEDVYNPARADGRRKRREAVFSVGRRNGKTLLASILVLAHLVGPAKKANSTVMSAANTRDQASLVFRMCDQLVRASPILRKQVKVIDSTKRIVSIEDGSVYRAISADAGTNLGAGIDFAVYDEYAQAKNNALYEALKTSMGSQPEGLLLSISTQAPTDTHPFSILIDYGLRIKAGEFADDSFTLHLFSAPAGCDLMDRSAWKMANPGLDDYRDLLELEQSMERASRLPSLENSMRVYYLNQRVRADGGLLSPSVWEQGNRPVDIDLFFSGRNVVAGLDLSSRIDLTSCVFAVEDDDANIHLLPYAWTPEDTLIERSAKDRAPYDVWQRQGYIQSVPGKAIDYDFVATKIAEISGRMNFQKLAYDRWRVEIMRQSLARIGFYVNLVEFGQGFKDMSPAVEAFEELALMGKIVHGNHPVLKWCVGNAVVEMDAAGNRKLTKAAGKMYGRIDVAVAALMAVGALKGGDPFVDISALVA